MSSEADYLVGPTIGEGAFGHVLYGVHKATDREVAIKVMEVASQGNRLQHVQKTKTQMILNERKILSLPNLKDSKWTVDLWAAFCGRAWACSTSSQSLFFVMKLATGGDLAGLIRRGLHRKNRGFWRQHSTKWYASQLIKAVDFLHFRNIVHCDLKPDNILLDSEGNLCLADFGSALDLKDDQHEQLFLRGTALYACPELLRASSPSDITVACDHWSVGCILYAMVHGSSPFDRGSEALTVDAICSFADSGGSESAWKQVEAAAEKVRDEEDGEPTDEDLDENLKTLSRDLLTVLPDDRISAWKEKANPFLSLNDSEEGGDCPKNILLPVPEWKEEVEKSTLRDGSLGWVAFQPL